MTARWIVWRSNGSRRCFEGTDQYSQTKIPPLVRGGIFVNIRLFHQIRQQSHKSRALDREGEFALVPGADAGAFARHDLSKGGKVATKRVRIFVVDVADVNLAEVTRTFDAWL